MGAWGTGITSNDEVSDVVESYLHEYDNNRPVEDILPLLENANADWIKMEDVGYLFWIGIALAQWRVGSLEEKVLVKVEDIERSGIDTKAWEDLGGSKSDINKRKEVLRNFITKLKSKNLKPRKRRKILLKDSPYQVGDVLVFKHRDEFFGACVVFIADRQKEYPNTAVVLTEIKSQYTPSLSEVRSSNVYLEKLYGDREEEEVLVNYLFNDLLRSPESIFIKIGNIKVNPNKIIQHQVSGSLWRVTLEIFENNRKSKHKISLKRFLGSQTLLEKILLK